MRDLIVPGSSRQNPPRQVAFGLLLMALLILPSFASSAASESGPPFVLLTVDQSEGIESCPLRFDLPLTQEKLAAKGGYITGLTRRVECAGVKVQSMKVERRGPALAIRPMFSVAKGQDYSSDWRFSLLEDGQELCKGRSGAMLDEGEINWEDPVLVRCGDEKLNREGLVLRVEVLLHRR